MKDLPFEGDQFKEAWNEWLQYRSQRKEKKYVPIGLKKTFTRLVNDSGNNVDTAIKMINNAMEMSWRGIYPINESNANTKQLITQSKESRNSSYAGGF